MQVSMYKTYLVAKKFNAVAKRPKPLLQGQGFPYGAIFETGGTINTWRSTRQSNPRQAKI